MQYDRILIRYGEISTKKRNRGKFVEKLKKGIKYALAGHPSIEIDAERDRMHILLNGAPSEPVIEKVRKVFGIHSLSPAIRTERDIPAMKEAAFTLMKSFYTEGKTFKITAKRSDKTFELDTDGINQLFGAFILTSFPGITVNVRKPDINLQIEVRKEAVYLSCETIRGAGGLPIGTGGKAMLMLSGGIDSPVAGYLAMKRGVELEAIHFHSPPFTSERAKQKVIDLAEKLSEVSGSILLHIVPFTEVQQAIKAQIPENYSMTATRRSMLRIADQIRKKQGGLAIITGESLGQVASQTLESMYAINDVTNTPVLRPLISMDKTEIIEVATELGTYDISILPYEDCCTIFVPSSPKTKPKKDKVLYYESFLEFEPIEASAVEGTETIRITPGYSSKTVGMDNLF
ncbi:tRNA 4-thiouridine(8) synthase ThiI [Neobacillus notoginsengisoli]|uniref:Probable tRNA sulfurtransferase n=1 Tax=Neobacillus notoginsengisoli TaxID=1578198 RepID=A0A417YUC3_9BACI|nr:tRNA uracil 4-sulfurtransferase ThiI [Neobacillus notoginsengisoli]RHW40760.1 tRNA 4-thiouridine(8) synthase ThiI [Neobacillus notoginsengisoli]